MQLNIKNITKHFGGQTLFQDASFLVHDQDRIAFIGQNGTGKTTLFRCLSGEEECEGTIKLGKGTTISVMEQERSFEKAHLSFSKYLEEKRKKIETLKETFELKLGDQKVYDDVEEFNKVLQEYELLYTSTTEKIEERVLRNILTSLKFNMEDYEKPIAALSGGQQTKLRLAECLSRKVSVYLLDEPTNHLDFDTLEWLEKTILEMNKTFLVVSHDRYFLERIATKVIEIENKTFKVYPYPYAKYLVGRAAHQKTLAKEYAAITHEKKRLLDSAKEKRQWAAIHQNHTYVVQAQNLERRAANLPDVVDPSLFEKNYTIHFDNRVETGTIVFEAQEVQHAYNGKVVFDHVTVNVHKGDKIALIGPNGAGKTTLLKILGKILEPTKGVINHGPNLKIGYFDQELKTLDPNKKVIEIFQEYYSHRKDHDIISLAIKLGFPQDKFQNKIKVLSGGEKARLNLVRLMTGNCNVLLLDEPTNNLDLQLIETLESSLKEYKGTVVFVSHDRKFINSTATRLFRIDAGVVKEYKGNYSQNFS